MAVFKPKSRMVSFRLSEEEYRNFSSTCAQKGAHSLSEFARETICLRIAKRARTPEEKLRLKMGRLEHTIRELTLEVARLAQMVETQAPPKVMVAGGER